MSGAGPVPIQGCAIRVSALNPDGSVLVGSSGMIVDDKPFVKWTAKPTKEAGVEIVPKSACGALLVAYKDRDRIKRWDVTLDFGDADFDKMALLGGGDLVMAPTSAGRTVSDGVTTLNSTTITSATAAFVATDVGRTVTNTGIPAGAYITEITSATAAVISAPATATATAQSLVFGAIASRPVAYRFPQLLQVTNPNGVGIEIWQKAIVRGTGYQGVTPYPSVGSTVTPFLTPSAWIRWGFFRVFLDPDAQDIEDKESMQSYVGWAIENPLFGTGPNLDWTTTGVAGGPPIDTTRWCNAMMDFQLPSPLQPGFQTSL